MSRDETHLSRRSQKSSETKSVLNNRDIIQILNTNFNLIMDANGQRQSWGSFKAVGIIHANKKDVIKRKNVNSNDEIRMD